MKFLVSVGGEYYRCFIEQSDRIYSVAHMKVPRELVLCSTVPVGGRVDLCCICYRGVC